MLKKPIQEQEIIELFNIHYGINIQAVQFITGGAEETAWKSVKKNS
jgi:hypothetical protein